MLKNTLQLDGATLTVRPQLSIPPRHKSTQREMGNYHDPDEPINQQGRNDEGRSTGRHAVPPTNEPLIAPRNVILVSGIKETTTGELIKMFFENKKRSGGGPVKKLDYQNNERQATITFLNDKGSYFYS